MLRSYFDTSAAEALVADAGKGLAAREADSEDRGLARKHAFSCQVRSKRARMCQVRGKADVAVSRLCRMSR